MSKSKGGWTQKLGELTEHPDEILATLSLLYRQWKVMGTVGSGSGDDDEAAGFGDPKEKWCYWILNKVSRSFALVISELGPEMRKAIMVFYLVLRALDTVEDDMDFPEDKKLPLLLSFHEVLDVRGWHLTGCGANRNEVELMENFYLVIDQFLSLKKGYRTVIRDITRRMGAGMARFFTDDTAHRVESLEDWDKYCHYVAGLVGIGLSDLFASSTLEDAALSSEEGHRLANAMGLLLQKTNIIRDYHEDMTEARAFWPERVWRLHAPNGRLEDFLEPQHRERAVHCLNQLVGHALGHLPDCIAYLQRIRVPSNFAFCAIPQVMAVATLAACYNNPQVFTPERVKMRLGEMSVVFHRTLSMHDVLCQFDRYLEVIQRNIPSGRLDPTAADTRLLVAQLRALTAPAARQEAARQSPAAAVPDLLTGLLFSSGSSFFVRPKKAHQQRQQQQQQQQVVVQHDHYADLSQTSPPPSSSSSSSSSSTPSAQIISKL